MNESRIRSAWLTALLLAVASAAGWAGPFSPDGGRTGSSALSWTNAGFIAWASDWVEYAPGEDLYTGEPFYYVLPEKALGPATNSIFDGGDTNAYSTVSLGNGGSLTVTFADPIRDADGFDFAVFENGFPLAAFFTNSFLEFGYVEASADGTNFVRFPSTSLIPSAVGPYSVVDPTLVDGLAGKASVGWGTPFDLAAIGLDRVIQVRIVDIIGTGTNGCFDSASRPIYDPSPVYGSAGFDLDAVGVFRTRDYAMWRLAHFSTADAQDNAVSGVDADPDADGLPNLVEYALRLPPRSGARGPGPRVESGGPAPVFRFERHPDKRDVVMDVEMSADLATWTPVARSTNGAPFEPLEPVPSITVTESGDDVVQTVSVQPVTPGPSGFFRLRASLP